MTNDHKIIDEKLQQNANREASKISALLAGKIDKHQLSHNSEYNMTNIFQVSHILTYFTNLQASEIIAKHEKLGKYWPYCAR